MAAFVSVSPRQRYNEIVDQSGDDVDGGDHPPVREARTVVVHGYLHSFLTASSIPRIRSYKLLVAALRQSRACRLKGFERLTAGVSEGDGGGSAVSQTLAGFGALRRDTLVLDELKPECRLVMGGSSRSIADRAKRARRGEHSRGLHTPPNSRPPLRSSSPRDSLGSDRVAVFPAHWAPTPQRSPWSAGVRDRTCTSCCQPQRE